MRVYSIVWLAILLFCFLFSTAVNAAIDGSGKYMKHTYSFQKQGEKYAVIFKPALPRNDTVLTGAMLELINKVFGKHQIVDLKPKLVPRGNANLILFEGIKNNYFFLLIKQDSGEVNGFSMWKEGKL